MRRHRSWGAIAVTVADLQHAKASWAQPPTKPCHFAQVLPAQVFMRVTWPRETVSTGRRTVPPVKSQRAPVTGGSDPPYSGPV